MSQTKIDQLKDATCIADNQALEISLWENNELIFLMVRGVVVPFTSPQFNEFSELVSKAFLYLNSIEHKEKN